MGTTAWRERPQADPERHHLIYEERHQAASGKSTDGGRRGREISLVSRSLLFRLGGKIPEALPQVKFLQPALGDGRPYDELTRQVVKRYARFWICWGLYWQAAGKCPQAIQAYEAALAVSPTMEEARVGIASCR